MELYPHQQRGLDLGLPVLTGENKLRSRIMLTAPTGTGKGLLAAVLCNAARERGMNCGVLAPTPFVAEQLIAKGCPEEHTWTSAVKYLNRLKKGEIAPYDEWVVDEGHHSIAETVDMALATAGRAVALTATGFRGTPKGTIALHKAWGTPIPLISMREAAEKGFMVIPEFYPCPIVDDDLIETQNGEFTEKSATQVVGAGLPNILDDLLETYDGRPGVLILPSRILARRAYEELTGRLDARLHLLLGEATTGKSVGAEREAAAQDVVDNLPVLIIAVGVMGEGVDMPNLRDMWDASPTRSPVVAMQRWGRVCRPGPDSHIRVYSRNIERFAYLYDGLMPPAVVGESQMGFGGPSKQGVRRGTLDIEVVRRFKPLPVPLADGSWAEGHMLWARGSDNQQGEWALIWLPWKQDPVCAYRNHDRGKWMKVDPPESLEGYSTSGRRWPMSEKQERWWKQQAKVLGLNPGAEVDARTFAFLPALSQSKQNVRVPK